MGKNPSAIFRDLYKRAKQTQDIIASIPDAKGSKLIAEMNEQDGCYYVTFETVIKSFLMEGYSVSRANKHIDQWIDYDILFVRYKDGFKFIGFGRAGFSREMA